MSCFSAPKYLLVFLWLASCGTSPVSIEDDQSLTHKKFGFSIHLPDSLCEQGWSIDASKKVSKYDSHYSFSFVPPDRQPAYRLQVYAAKRTPYTSVWEWAEQLLAANKRWLEDFLQRRPDNKLLLDEYSLAPYPFADGTDAVARIEKTAMGSSDLLSLDFNRTIHVFNGDVSIELRSQIHVSLAKNQMTDGIIAEYEQRFAKMVIDHECIIETLEITE